MDKIEINLKNVVDNCKNIKNKFPGYKYYMGVVKSDAYGLGMKAIKEISKEMDYLVVGNIDEAISVRKSKIDSPILVLLPIVYSEAKKYEKYNITATLDSLDVLDDIKDFNIKVHLKLNTGMNRFGLTSKEEIIEAYDRIKNSKLELEGIYTHLYSAGNKEITNNQIKLFNEFVTSIDYKNIPIIHVSQSEGLVKNPKIDIATGVRVGDLMYGLCDKEELGFKSTFSLTSNLRTVNKVLKGQTVGYDGAFKCENDEYIGIIPIGYSHGITKKQVGTKVIIRNREYEIIANTMNVTFIKVDNKVKVNDKVYVYKDISYIMKLSEELNTVPQEPMLLLKNIKKVYVRK